MLSTYKVLTQSEYVLSLCIDGDVRDLWKALVIHLRLKISLVHTLSDIAWVSNPEVVEFYADDHDLQLLHYR